MALRLVWFRGCWYAYERVDGLPKRTSMRTKDRDEAARRLVDLEHDRRRPAETIAELRAVYAEEHGPRIASPQTLQFTWARLGPVFGHLRPDQITRALTRSYAIGRRGSGVKDGTIRRELGVLSAIIRHSDKQSPATIELPPVPPPKSRHLTREQYRALRAAAEHTPHLALFVMLAYRTGGRAASILDLTWDRVDFERGLIRLGLGDRLMKGRATVPMIAETAAILRKARAIALTNRVIEYGGQPVLSVKRAFKTAVARAGLPPDTSPHILRHSAAVHMAESGVPMAEIAQFLGHSSETITFRTYARFSPTYLRRAAAALE